MKHFLRNILQSPAGTDGRYERPKLKKNNESSVRGLYVIGDLAGAPVIKLAMADGYKVIETIAALPKKETPLDAYDVVIVGAGAAGLNAALAAQEKGLHCIVIEKGKIANTIEDFPESKYIYAEPEGVSVQGKLWLDGATKETLLARWNAIIKDNQILVRTDEALQEVERSEDSTFRVITDKATYQASYVVLATGQRGNPRTLGVPGEEQEHIYHRLYSPRKYQQKRILIVGGGNSAVEAALTLCDSNDVTISYRGSEFARLFKDNAAALKSAIEAGKVQVLFNSTIESFSDTEARVRYSDKRSETIVYDYAFVLIGADLPVVFLKKLGLTLENEWRGNAAMALFLAVLALVGIWFFQGSWSQQGSIGFGVFSVALIALGVAAFRGDRYSYLGISFLVCYSVYAAKVGHGDEFWPFQNWGYNFLSIFDRPWAFWYTVLYTLIMTVFGLQSLYRWGLARGDSFQIWRFTSLILFQWLFFFLIPEVLFQWAVDTQFVGRALAEDPQFATQAWRSYGIVYAWPLFFYTFFYDPHQLWVFWGIFLSFVVLPVLVLFHGKRYCSWICGCGGLAETLGDRWRHLAPKGKKSIAWEKMSAVIFIFAAVLTVAYLVKDMFVILRAPTESGMKVYRLFVDVWLVGIIPVTLYPFLGGKIWCRYWCPLAKMMQYFSSFYSQKKWSRFSIEASDTCIACAECSRYCQVGIDVMSYALKQERLDNLTSSCIGCGICVTVCPMDTLSFGHEKPSSLTVLNNRC